MIFNEVVFPLKLRRRKYKSIKEKVRIMERTSLFEEIDKY